MVENISCGEPGPKMILRLISSSVLIVFAIFAARALTQISVASDAPVPESLYDLNINNLAKPNVWPVEHFTSFRTFSFRWYNIERQLKVRNDVKCSTGHTF